MTPSLYILAATAILAVLFTYRPSTTWPGLLIVVFGIPIYWLIGWAGRKRNDGIFAAQTIAPQDAE